MGIPDSCDPALLELFRAEMDAHVPVLSQGLLALEKGRATDKDLEGMMRAAHSIKGAARIVGIEAAVRVSHVMEDCFLAAQGHRVALGSEAVDVLLQGVDALQRICSPEADSAMTEPAILALLDRIAAVRDGKSSSPAPPAEQAPPVAPVPEAQAPSAARPRESRLTLPAVLDEPAAESLRVELSNTLQHESSLIRLDFSQVKQLSATALALFTSFARETARPGTATIVRAEGVSQEMAVLLRTTTLDCTFKRSE